MRFLHAFVAQVIFDPGIGCYYDPKTNKYYELRA